MKKLFFIFALPLMLLSGCSKDDDTLSDQYTKMVSYLTGTHAPKLIAETDVEEDGDVDYYSTVATGVYRYIADIYDPERPARPEVTSSSVVTITFSAYVFSFSNIITPENRPTPTTAVTMPFISNDPLLEQAMYDTGLTPGVWVFEPLKINMRNSGIIKGLYAALLGCRQGDYVEAYMTYDNAYGDVYFSMIPKDSPVAWFFTVDSVD